jgi:hypothetical protein
MEAQLIANIGGNNFEAQFLSFANLLSKGFPDETKSRVCFFA